jgi:hypothetical protein
LFSRLLCLLPHIIQKQQASKKAGGAKSKKFELTEEQKQELTRAREKSRGSENARVYEALFEKMQLEVAALRRQTFEDRELALFGREGFEGVVGQVAELEKRLGIDDLAQFTPRASA